MEGYTQQQRKPESSESCQKEEVLGRAVYLFPEAAVMTNPGLGDLNN